MCIQDQCLAPGLELRLLTPQHADELFAVIDNNRAHLRQWLPWLDVIRSVEDEITFLRRAEEQTINQIAFNFGIFCDEKIAGVIGIHPIDVAKRKVEIGYWLDAGHEGKGLMTMACRAVVGIAFQELKLNRVIIYCATGNRRSRAIPERLGFKLEGIHREAEWLFDHFVDLACYSMLAREWND